MNVGYMTLGASIQESDEIRGSRRVLVGRYLNKFFKKFVEVADFCIQKNSPKGVFYVFVFE